MNKVTLLAFVCSLSFIGLSSLNDSTISYQAASIHKEDTQKMISIENFITKTKLEYKNSEQLSSKNLKAILYEVGFRGSNLKKAWAVAMKESTGRPMAHNDNPKTGDNSYGLFQINMIGSLGPARLEQYKLNSYKDLFEPLVNARIAFQMSDGGNNWSAWNGIGKSTTKWFSEYPG